MNVWLNLISLIVVLLPRAVGAAVQISDPVWVEPRTYQGVKANRAAALKSEKSLGHGARILLDPIEQEQIDKRLQSRSPGPEKIGFLRPVLELDSFNKVSKAMDWFRSEDGGHLGHLQIHAPGASALRLSLLFSGLPSSAELRFHGAGIGPVEIVSGSDILALQKINRESGASPAEAEVYWSPVIAGESGGLEFYLPPDVPLDQVQFRVPGISYMTVDPSGQLKSGFQERAAGACNLDSRCYADWSGASNAVARITFVEDGYSYLCTGTLLNNSGQSDTPYFLTANHCISTQLAASSLNAYWFYYSSNCNSGEPYSGITTTLGGARLLYNAASTDAAFLLLNNLPPSGVTFSGWTNTTPDLGFPATGLHNPTGDLQKISFGTTQDYLNCKDEGNGNFSCNRANQSNANFIDIPFVSGITEGGSSGSGIFLDNNRYLFGQLYGGDSSCSNPYGSNIYGLFSKTYFDGQLQQWLVTKSEQTITMSVPSAVVVNQSAAISATASSGLPVSLISTTPGTCSVASNRVTGLAIGLCVIKGFQAGNDAYGSAESSASLMVVGIDQTLTFIGPLQVTWGTTATVSVNSSAGLPVVMQSKTPANCMVTGNVLQGIYPGDCLIESVQEGDSTYKPARLESNLAVVMPHYPTPTRILTIKTSGDGTVQSDPVGIDCGKLCEFRFSRASRVELLANPADGNRFLGWSGACTGKKLTCSVRMNARKLVKARFAR